MCLNELISTYWTCEWYSTPFVCASFSCCISKYSFGKDFFRLRIDSRCYCSNDKYEVIAVCRFILITNLCIWISRNESNSFFVHQNPIRSNNFLQTTENSRDLYSAIQWIDHLIKEERFWISRHSSLKINQFCCFAIEFSFFWIFSIVLC